MNVVRKPFALGCVVSAGLTMLAMAGCGQANQSPGEPTGTSLDPLLFSRGGDAGIPDSGVFACPACIQSSCSDSIRALETELKNLGSEARSAFDCVVSSHCFAMFSIARDAGGAAGRSAVEACVAACDTDAGLPDRDAARSAVMTLVAAVDACVDSSCATQCPGAARDMDDQ
jgi:hypothetical protein